VITISADFNMADIEAYIREEEEAWYDEIIASLRTTGRTLVDKARAQTREDGGFGNITWNLRGSIVMCLVDEEGKIFETYAPPITKGAHGTKIGKEMAEALAVYGRNAQEITMVFVAAENYATFVQAKGKDVIKHVIGDNLESALRKVLGE
jgi:hypothetical protein